MARSQENVQELDSSATPVDENPTPETDDPKEMTISQVDALGLPLGHYLNPVPQDHEVERFLKRGR